MPTPVRDRFDDAPRTAGRVGAHRAEQPRMNRWLVFLWAVVATIVLVVLGTFAVFVATERITLFPQTTETPTGEPEDTGLIDTSYTVLILNGTADTGRDALTRDAIVNAGWKGADVFAGQSGTTDFAVTTVYYVEDEDLPAARGLASVLGGANLVKSDFYADSSDPEAKQLTVVLGLDE